jgi:branched-chain amino acid aminotransferase
MAAASFQGGRWSATEIKPVGPIELSPAAHVLHYASTCFEGF